MRVASGIESPIPPGKESPGHDVRIGPGGPSYHSIMAARRRGTPSGAGIPMREIESADVRHIVDADSRDIVDDLNARYGRPKPGAGVRLKEVLEGGAHADPAAEGDPDGSG